MLQHLHLPSITAGGCSLGFIAAIPSVTTTDLILKAIITVVGAIPTIINLLQHKKKKREKEKQQ